MFTVLLVALLALGAYADPIDETEIGAIVREIVKSFKDGLDNITPLEEFLGLPHVHQLSLIEEDIQDEVTEVFKESLYGVLETIENSLFQSEQLGKEALKTSKEFIHMIETEFEGKEDEAHELILNWAKSFKGRVEDVLKYVQKDILDKVSKENIIENVKELVKEKITVIQIRKYIYDLFPDNKDLAHEIWEEVYHKIFPKIDQFLDVVFDRLILNREDKAGLTYFISCALLKLLLKGVADADKIIEFIKTYLPESLQGQYMEVFLNYGVKGLIKFLETICIVRTADASSLNKYLPPTAVDDFSLWLRTMLKNGFLNASKPISEFVNINEQIVGLMKNGLKDGFKISIDNLSGLSEILGPDFLKQLEEIKAEMDDLFSSS